jgi:hypothetical protein
MTGQKSVSEIHYFCNLSGNLSRNIKSKESGKNSTTICEILQFFLFDKQYYNQITGSVNDCFFPSLYSYSPRSWFPITEILVTESTVSKKLIIYGLLSGIRIYATE